MILKLSTLLPLSPLSLDAVHFMLKSARYWNRLVTCTCETCISENPSGHCIALHEQQTHENHQLQQLSAIHQHGASRLRASLPSHGRGNQPPPIGVHGRRTLGTNLAHSVGRGISSQLAPTSQVPTYIGTNHPTDPDWVFNDLKKVRIHNIHANGQQI
jgi:hypothetical protein